MSGEPRLQSRSTEPCHVVTSLHCLDTRPLQFWHRYQDQYISDRRRCWIHAWKIYGQWRRENILLSSLLLETLGCKDLFTNSTNCLLVKVLYFVDVDKYPYFNLGTSFQIQGRVEYQVSRHSYQEGDALSEYNLFIKVFMFLDQSITMSKLRSPRSDTALSQPVTGS